MKQRHFIGRMIKIFEYLWLYEEGKCSLDKAAAEVGITVNEMMQEAAKVGIPSTETIAEYKEGLALLS